MQSFGGVVRRWLPHIVEDEEVAFLFLKELWPQMMGSHLARHVRVRGLRQKILWVEVSGQAWKETLAEIRGGMLERINTYWGGTLVRDIQVSRESSSRGFQESRNDA